MARGERRQNLARLGEIAQVAARHGFGYAFGRNDGSSEDVTTGAGRNRGRRMREMLDELGPTFVKFGQLLSTRPDVVPPDILGRAARPAGRRAPGAVRADPGGGRGRARAHDRAGLRWSSTRSPSRPRRSARSTPPGCPGASRWWSRSSAPTPSASSTPTSSCSTRPPGRAATGSGGCSSSTWWGRSTSSPGRCGASSTTASRPATPRSSAATSPATTRVAVPKVYWRYTHRPACSRWSGSRARCSASLDLGDVVARRPHAARRTGSPRPGCRWSSSTASSTPTRIRPTSWCAAPTSISLVDFGMTEQLTQRDREAAVRLLIDILDQDAERLPRRLRALGVRYPRQHGGGARPTGSAVIVQRYSASRDRRDRRPRGAAGDLRDDLPPRHHAPRALGDARQDGRDARRASALEIYPDLNVFEVARPYAVRMAAAALPARPHRRPGAGRRGAATPRRSSTTPSRSPSCSTSSRTATSRSRIRPEGFDRGGREGRRPAPTGSSSPLIAAALILGSAVIAVFAHSDRRRRPVADRAPRAASLALALVAWLCVGIFRSGRW